MSIIRRLYLYAVAFISLLVITWGLIGLARSAFAGDEIGGDVAALAGALALIFVGIPVFLLHWWLAQRSASRDIEERFSYIRSAFLYGALLATLIPISQNLMALINRVLFSSFDLSNDRAMFGFDQTWSDNLIAMGMNGLIAAYIFSVLRKDWAAEPIGNAFSETRRLYRYIWVIYGLGLMISGVQQTLLFIFDSLEGGAISSQAILANGLTLIIVGTPIWVFSWRIVQKSISSFPEQGSLLRAVVLFIVNLISMVVTLFASGAILVSVFQIIFGERLSAAALMGDLRDPISVAIPFGICWAYFSRTRRNDRAAFETIPRQLNSLQHLLKYLSAFLGLWAFFVSLQQLIYFVINQSVKQPIWSDVYREQLSIAITILLIGLPLWLMNWRKVNRKPSENVDDSIQTQGSIVRRVYLYLTLFISVIGVMISAGILVFQVLQALLGDPDENLLQISFELISLLVLFSLVIWYHGYVLQADGRQVAETLAEQHSAFPILILVSELGVFNEVVVAALSREAPTMPVVVHIVERGVPDDELSDAKAVILPASLAAGPGEAIRLWLQNFDGFRFVIPTQADGWVWVSGDESSINRMALQTAKMIRQLAEGEKLTQTRSTSPWLVLASILGGLLGLGLLLTAISILIDVLS